ncbi:MAG: hypothetical protein CL840_01620 [Crocinitomicaceae bacterium]|nr:hypothetical protein [Crocinitomicaceae bacterium]
MGKNKFIDKLMRPFLISFLLSTLCITALHSQENEPQVKVTINTNDSGYIHFSDANFIAMLKLSKTNWELEMKRLGYSQWGDEGGILMYIKGEFPKTWHLSIYDYKLDMVGLLWWDLVRKEKTMDEYRSQMPDTYQMKNIHGTTYERIIDGKKYTVIMSSPNDVVSEEVRFGYKE